MKKLFKMMALALLTSGMFLACEKPNPDPDPDPDPEPPVESNYVRVTFDGTTWDATTFEVSDQYASQVGVLLVDAYKDYNDENAASVGGYMPANPGTYVKAQGNYYYVFYYENDGDLTIDTDGSLTGQAGAQLPNWQPENGFTETVTAIDMTAMTISGTATGNMFYLPDYINNVETEKELSVTFKEAVWTAGK